MSAACSLIWIFAWLIMDGEAYKSGCIGGYCFVMSDISNNIEFLNQYNAQQWCLSNGTQLAEIRSQSTQNALANFIANVYSQGLNGWSVLTNGKRYSRSDWFRLNGNGIGNLAVREQTGASDFYGYLKSTNSGFDLFASRPTNNKGGFICTGLSDCSGGVTIGGLCYKSFSEALPWYDARNRCLDKGGDLAIFEYVTTNAGFNTLNGSWLNASNSYWIGIRIESWTWKSSTSPDSEVKHSDWLTGQPTSVAGTDCLCLSTQEDLKWTACNCNQQSPFVCITDTNPTTPSSTSASSKTTRPTNPWPTTTKTRKPSSTTTTTRTTSRVASGSSGVASPTIPSTVTSNSTPPGIETGIMDQSMGLSREVAIVIGVGVGVDGALVIVALVVIVIILTRKRSSLRQALPSLKTDQKKQIV